MPDATGGLVCVGFGCLVIFLDKPFGRLYARLQRLLLGFDPGRRGVRCGRTVVAFVGTTLLLLGLSLLLYSPSVGP